MNPGIAIYLYIISNKSSRFFKPFIFNYWEGDTHLKGVGFNFYLFGISFAFTKNMED